MWADTWIIIGVCTLVLITWMLLGDDDGMNPPWI